ncbi:MAG: hypothetical protein H6811_09630 [Phycisphaeraceae bacterium]|nr:hypothetical protein [Phycisphaeraceae bacterium]
MLDGVPRRSGEGSKEFDALASGGAGLFQVEEVVEGAAGVDVVLDVGLSKPEREVEFVKARGREGFEQRRTSDRLGCWGKMVDRIGARPNRCARRARHASEQGAEDGAVGVGEGDGGLDGHLYPWAGSSPARARRRGVARERARKSLGRMA